MEKNPGPPGYPGDSVVQKALGAVVRAFRLERGWSEKEAAAELRRQAQADRHEFLPQALALTLRRVRKQRNMSCQRLSELSGLSLRFLLSIESAKTRDVLLTDLFRIGAALHYPAYNLAQESIDLEQELKRCAERGQAKKPSRGCCHSPSSSPRN
jgi:hypothetical protein